MRRITRLALGLAILTTCCFLAWAIWGWWKNSNASTKADSTQIVDRGLTSLPKTPIIMIRWDQKRTNLYPNKSGFESIISLQWADAPTKEDQKLIQPLLVEMAKKQLRIASSERVYYLPLQSADKKDWTVEIRFTSDLPSRYGALRRKPPTWIRFDDGSYYPSNAAQPPD